jgi:hypothetical protein
MRLIGGTEITSDCTQFGDNAFSQYNIIRNRNDKRVIYKKNKRRVKEKHSKTQVVISVSKEIKRKERKEGRK